MQAKFPSGNLSFSMSELGRLEHFGSPEVKAWVKEFKAAYIAELEKNAPLIEKALHDFYLYGKCEVDFGLHGKFVYPPAKEDAQ